MIWINATAGDFLASYFPHLANWSIYHFRVWILLSLDLFLRVIGAARKTTKPDHVGAWLLNENHRHIDVKILELVVFRGVRFHKKLGEKQLQFQPFVTEPIHKSKYVWQHVRWGLIDYNLLGQRFMFLCVCVKPLTLSNFQFGVCAYVNNSHKRIGRRVTWSIMIPVFPRNSILHSTHRLYRAYFS